MQKGGPDHSRRGHRALAGAIGVLAVLTVPARAGAAPTPQTPDTTVPTTPPTVTCGTTTRSSALGRVPVVVLTSSDPKPEEAATTKGMQSSEASGYGIEVRSMVAAPKPGPKGKSTLDDTLQFIWDDPAITIVVTDPGLASEVEIAESSGRYYVVPSLGAVPTGDEIVSGRKDKDGAEATQVDKLTLEKVSPDPTSGVGPATIVRASGTPGDEASVEDVSLLLADGTTVACPAGAMALPIEVSVTVPSEGNGLPSPIAVLDAAADVVRADGSVQPVGTGQYVALTQQTRELVAGNEKLTKDLNSTKAQLTKLQNDDGGTGFTPFLIVLVLGLLGAIAYLLTRKPPVSHADAFAAMGPSPSTPGGLAGTMASGHVAAAAAPAPPPLPPRYTEPPPAPHGRPPAPAPGWTGSIPGGAAVRLEDLGLMRVVAKDVGRGKTWSHETDRWMLASGWLEKVAGKGEDAEPAVRVHQSGAGFLAVFDGTGGSGSASARRLTDGTDLSGAYVASRLSKEVAEAWATEQIDRNEGPVRPDELRDRLARSLQDEALYPDVPKSTMKGSLQRVLPTTMAAVRFASDATGIGADVLWAGDSRAYVLTPAGGLQVLSIDDTRETDALELIRNDQPMSNLISADRPFTVNHLRYQVEQPGILLTATDGCFGYVRTPAHFEFLLLDSLDRMSSLDTWAADLVDSLASIASDDASFALGAFGFGSYQDLRDAFGPRRDFLAEHHWAPFQQTSGQPEEIEALRISSWASYRELYHARVLSEPVP